MNRGEIREGFTFDDVAFFEPTETFEYQIDWGDGEVTPWMDDFRFPEEIEGGGLGLDGIIERAEQIDGDLTIDSWPDRGTTIKIEVPNE